MRIRSTPQSSPEHWSKDFVEHLRTVHFALVAVSVGLMVILWSKPYDARVASSELTDIIEIRDALSKDPSSLAMMTIAGGTGMSDPHKKTIMYSPWLVAESAKEDAANQKKRYIFHIASKRLACRVSGDVYSYFTDSDLPNNIRTFKQWWDYLGTTNGFTIDTIVNINARGLVDNDEVEL